MAWKKTNNPSDLVLAEGLEPRHHVVIETMIRFPQWTQAMVANSCAYSPGQIRQLQRHPLFQAEYQRRKDAVEQDIRKAIVDATVSAIQFSRGVVEDMNHPLPLRQESARDILVQGHAKAVEKSASLRLEANLPPEAFAALAGIAKELQIPMKMMKQLERPSGEEEPIEVESK